MSDDPEILFERVGQVAIVTLNRPNAINALTLGMVRAIAAILNDCERDLTVRLVLIRGAGDRGLCAGGDIRAIYGAALSEDPAPITFWREEYDLNRRIARFPKPVVAVMNGIVMGGGIGLSAHASHRIVTETTSIAMPETSIGFVPDVGGTYLLSRSPGELGTHVALTSGRVGAADAILLGLADAHVSSDRLAELVEALHCCGSAGEIEAAFGRFATSPAPGGLAAAAEWIDAAYAVDSMEEVFGRLSLREEPGAREALNAMKRNSPTSLKVALRALRQARRFGRLEPCLDMELRIASHCFSGHDFLEGIRAAVIDKDRQPKWAPGVLEDVTDAMVSQYFEEAAVSSEEMA